MSGSGTARRWLARIALLALIVGVGLLLDHLFAGIMWIRWVYLLAVVFSMVWLAQRHADR